MMFYFLLLIFIYICETKGVPQSSLSSNTECVNDFNALSTFCGLRRVDMDDDIAAINCVQSVPNADKIVSIKCQHIIWNYKRNIVESPSVLARIKKACQEDLHVFSQCINQADETNKTSIGVALSCIFDKKSVISGVVCIDAITKIQSIIFSDFRLMSGFVEKCASSISKLECGRLDSSKGNVANLGGSQGYTIECLSRNLTFLYAPCRKQVLKIMQAQAENYQLDRSLFLVCREARKRFCGNIIHGNGRIFSCLLDNIMEPEMGQNCKDQLNRRQNLAMQVDFHINAAFAKICEAEILAANCLNTSEPGETASSQLSDVLICLIDAKRSEQLQVSHQCLRQMKLQQKILMRKTSSQLFDKCRSEINDHCKDVTNGNMIHCLMKLLTNENNGEKSVQVSSECDEEIQKMILMVNPASDWKMDPVLESNCQSVVLSSCNAVSGGEAVMKCLLTLLANQAPEMTSRCGQTLIEIEYFMARDYSLDPELYRKCKHDAKRLCNASNKWHRMGSKKGKHKFVFPCLVRYLYEDDVDEDNINTEHLLLDEDCAEEVERVLEQRAISVNLHPEIELYCREYLINNCATKTQIGEEMNCLQEGLSNLKGECLNSVRMYTMMEAKNLNLNVLIRNTCQHAVRTVCKDQKNVDDDGSLIQCLIGVKDSSTELDDMGQLIIEPQCRAAIEHWQIISLQDWKFSYKFKKYCQKDIEVHCATNRQLSKAEVVSCLSEINLRNALSIFSDDNSVSNNMIPEPQLKISDKCKDQLTFQLLQKHSSLKLNPLLASSCSFEIQKYCSSLDSETDTVECLEGLDHRLLSSVCQSHIFEEEMEDRMINSLDITLAKVCFDEIKQFCHTQMSHDDDILSCLKKAKETNAYNFRPKCKHLVTKRIVMQSKDYRLNTQLHEACRSDIDKFCSTDQVSKSGFRFTEGSVIDCLKGIFGGPGSSGKKLSPDCYSEVRSVIYQASLHFEANPQLMIDCSINLEICKRELHYNIKNEEVDGTLIEECLKKRFLNKSLSPEEDGDVDRCALRVARLIRLSNIDIYIDPMLHKSCALDLAKLCNGVSMGNGQQMACLTAFATSSSSAPMLETECKNMLDERMDMYRMALKVVPLNGIKDVVDQMIVSNQSHYFLVVILAIFGLIFLMGILCGRLAYSMQREMKDR